MSGSADAAWHPDPYGRHEHRYWNGSEWTEHVADNGVSAVDHVAAGTPVAADDSAGSAASGSIAATGGPSTDPSSDPTTVAPTPVPDTPATAGQAAGWTPTATPPPSGFQPPAQDFNAPAAQAQQPQPAYTPPVGAPAGQYQAQPAGGTPPPYNPAPADAPKKKFPVLALVVAGLLGLLLLGILALVLSRGGGGGSSAGTFTEDKPYITKTFDVKRGEAFRYRFLPSTKDGEWDDDLEAILIESVTEGDAADAIRENSDFIEDRNRDAFDDVDLDDDDEIIEEFFRNDQTLRDALERGNVDRDDDLRDIDDELISNDPFGDGRPPIPRTDGTFGGGDSDIAPADGKVRVTVIVNPSDLRRDDEFKGTIEFETGDRVTDDRDLSDAFNSDFTRDTEDFLSDEDWFTGTEDN